MVIGFPIVVLEFPVRLEFPVLALAQMGCAYLGASDKLLERFHMFFDRWCFAIEVNEDPVMPDGATHWDEAELAAIEISAAAILRAI